MELRQLRYFLALAEALHVGNAADRLAVTAQSLGEQITALERSLGVLLFERSSTSGVTLTHGGERLLPYAASTVSTADELLEAASALSTRPRRTIRLGVSPFALTAPALAVLTRFRRHHPDTDVAMRQFSWSDPSAGVLSGKTDVALVRIPFAAHVRLRTIPLDTEPILAAVPARHPLASASHVSLGRLAAEPFVEPAGVLDPVFALRWYLRGARPSGAPPNVDTGAATVDEWLGDVASGHGVALVPEGAVGIWRRPELAFVPVDGLPPSRLVIAWDPARSAPVAEDFASAVVSGSGEHLDYSG